MRKFKSFGYFCLLIVFLLLTACIRISGSKFYPETDWQQKFEKRIETKHFIFYVSKGEKVNIFAQEQFYEYIADIFGIEPEGKIIYIKCRDEKHLRELTGLQDERIGALAGKCEMKKGNFVPCIISPEEWENHELVHVIQHLISESTTFFEEGLAIAYAINLPKGDYTPCIRFAWDLQMPITSLRHWMERGAPYIRIGQMLTTEDFKKALGFPTTTIAKLEAGNFVRYLIDTYGLEKFVQFLRLSNKPNSKLEIEEKFLKIYGISIQKMEDRWLVFLYEENY